MELGLKGKKVIMNGGAHGIGLETVKLFTAEGADVAFFDPSTLLAVRRAVQSRGGQALQVQPEM